MMDPTSSGGASLTLTLPNEQAMGDIAIDVGHSSDISETSSTVLKSVDNQRESVMGVSLNEETANLIKYQKAFAASARVMTALDEALDTIINRMGTVGR